MFLRAFDALYTTPLFRLQALVRVTVISGSLTLAMILASLSILRQLPSSTESIIIVLSSILFTNILSDYISLFVVRRWLVLSKNSAQTSALLAPVIGAIIIAFCYIFAFHLQFYYKRFLFYDAFIYPWLYGTTISRDAHEFYDAFQNLLFLFMEFYLFFVWPTVIIHLWLPLMLFGVLTIRALRFLFGAVGLTQSFLRNGDEHPLKAIGFIAASIIVAFGGLIRLLQ